jgi:hypothetical protein
MDVEKLKYLKKEVTTLNRQYNAWALRSDEAEKLWDVLRYGCEFLEKDDDVCKHSLIKCKFPVTCVPEICPWDRPSSWSKNKFCPKK